MRMQRNFSKNMRIIFDRKSSQAGFTLNELILGSIAGIIVIGGSIMGLSSLLNSNQIAQAKTRARKETSKAIDYILSEVQEGSRISTNPATDSEVNLPTATEIASSLGVTAAEVSSFQPILAVEIPSLENAALPGVEELDVIYYVGPNVNNTWMGPQMVYRYGPKLNSKGQHTTTWETIPLIDKINNTVAAGDLACDAAWNQVVASTGSGLAGFSACINNDGRIAHLHLIRDISDQTTETYVAETIAYARADEVTIFTPPLTTPSIPSFSVGENNEIIIDSPSENVNVRIDIIGKGIECNAETNSFIPIDVDVAIHIDGQVALQSTQINNGNYSFTAPVGQQTEVIIGGVADPNATSCSPQVGRIATIENQENPDNVIGLKNGDTIPEFLQSRSGWLNQTDAVEFLEPYLSSDASSIVLEDNQAIWLFELFESNTNDSLFDQQDLVVLVSIGTTTN